MKQASLLQSYGLLVCLHQANTNTNTNTVTEETTVKVENNTWKVRILIQYKNLFIIHLARQYLFFLFVLWVLLILASTLLLF